MKMMLSALCLATMALSACGGEMDQPLDELGEPIADTQELAENSAEPVEFGTVSQALKPRDRGDDSCAGRCMALCSRDGRGGIDAGCGLACLAACSAPR